MSKTQKYIVCLNKDCKFGAEKCPHAHSSYDWVPTNDLYIKYPGIWDVEHRENVSKAEGIQFLQTLDEMKKLTTYYRTKMDNHCAQNIGRVGTSLQSLTVEVEEDECIKIAKKEYEERVKFLRQREVEWERIFQEGAVLLALNRETQQKLIDWSKDCQKWEIPNNHPRLALL